MTLGDLAHLALAAAHLVLVVRGLDLVRNRTHVTPAAVIVLLVGGALVWDNLIIAIGNTMGAGDALHLLSVPRFALHALLTPLIIIVAQQQAAISGATFARRAATRWTAIVVAVVLVVGGFTTEILHIDLVPILEAGVLRYTDPDLMAPIGSIVAVVAAIATGVVLRREHGDVTLLAGSILMFVASGAQPAFEGMLIGNTAEVVFMAAMFHACRLLASDGARPSATRSVPTAQPQDA